MKYTLIPQGTQVSYTLGNHSMIMVKKMIKYFGTHIWNMTIFIFFQKEFEKTLPKLASLPMMIILVYIILNYCIALMGVDCPKGNSLLTLNCSTN